MKHLFLLLACLFTINSVQAQNQKLAQEPVKFIPDVKAMMAATRNEAAIKTAAQLEQIWTANTFTSAQQAQVIDIAQRMLQKKFKARPHFERFFGALVSGVAVHKLSGSRLDELLQVTSQSLEKDDPQSFERFLAATYAFLNSKLLYQSPYNTLKVLNGNFSFAYREGAQASLKEIQASLPDFTSLPVTAKEEPLPAVSNAPPANASAPNAEDNFWNKASKSPKKASAGKKRSPRPRPKK